MKRLADTPGPSLLAPYGSDLGWDPGLVALQAVSDGMIAVSCFLILVAMILFIRRRRDLSWRWLVFLFTACLLSCGTSSLLAAMTIWQPLYWIEGIAKAITALLSAATAILLWPLMPQALALPSPADLRHVNRKLSLRIAENDRAARLLQESEARYRAIYNRTPVPLHTQDIEGRLNGISDYWCDLLQYSREDVLGRPLEDFCPIETAVLLAQRFAILRDGGELREIECLFRKKDGTFIDVLLSARLERDSLGQPLRILGVLTDVTGRKQAEQALRISEERLLQSQKMEAIGKLTGGIAHDFNNMLTVIDGNLEMLRPVLEDPHTTGTLAAIQLVDAAARASERAGKLTAQLLAFSRRQRLDPKPLVPDAVIEGMSELLSRTVGEQVTMHVEMHDETPWPCLADRNQLEAALLNLLINATHAITTLDSRTADFAAPASRRGRIRIAVRNASLQQSDIGWMDGNGDEAITPGDYVSISVADDGCGMSEEIRKRALEPFFTTKPIGEGTGLGLSQTYGFVRQSGGTMRIESHPGRGTVVEMLLPRAIAPQNLLPLSLQPQDGAAADDRPGIERSKDSPSAEQGVASLETLLIVEDEPQVLEIIAASLRMSGYVVICASDATLALAALRESPEIALIFTDIVMPGMDGVALAEAAWRIRPGIPVVFASGYSDEAVREKLPKGAMFLQKPYRIASVTRLIQAALTARRLPVA